MPDLFDIATIGNLTLSNRIIRSATWEGMANPDGSPGARLAELMARLARGGVGLIITGHAYVSPEGRGTPGQLGMDRDMLIPPHLRMTRSVRTYGGRIMLQLAHAGIHAPSQLKRPPGFLKNLETPEVSSKMDEGEIERVVSAFGAAAGRARRAGYNGVQIHAAHGYLISQFLSPAYNRRRDAYGGSLENRARLLMEVLRAVRGAVGSDFPVTVKLNAEDFIDDGFTPADSLRTADMLEAAGVDAVELSGGTPLSAPDRRPARRGRGPVGAEVVYYKSQALAFKERRRVPLILVGGIRAYETARSLIRSGTADFVAMSRPLIREPGLVQRWQSGLTAPSACISDNGCFRPAMTGRGVFCMAEKRLMAGRPKFRIVPDEPPLIGP